MFTTGIAVFGILIGLIAVFAPTSSVYQSSEVIREPASFTKIEPTYEKIGNHHYVTIHDYLPVFDKGVSAVSEGYTTPFNAFFQQLMRNFNL